MNSQLTTTFNSFPDFSLNLIDTLFQKCSFINKKMRQELVKAANDNFGRLQKKNLPESQRTIFSLFADGKESFVQTSALNRSFFCGKYYSTSLDLSNGDKSKTTNKSSYEQEDNEDSEKVQELEEVISEELSQDED